MGEYKYHNNPCIHSTTALCDITKATIYYIIQGHNLMGPTSLLHKVFLDPATCVIFYGAKLHC